VQPSDPASPHPVDELIARLIREQAEASPEDLDRIVQRIATAPFSRRSVRVPRLDRGLRHGHVVLGRTADSLDYHLAKRVGGELQWSGSTTADDYLRDLRAAVRHSQARILVYERSGDVCAATVTPTVEAVPRDRLGERWLPHLLVVYSARHGIVRTAYMFSDFNELDMPEAIRWLR
jgi:hypothetical protein